MTQCIRYVHDISFRSVVDLVPIDFLEVRFEVAHSGAACISYIVATVVGFRVSVLVAAL